MSKFDKQHLKTNDCMALLDKSNLILHLELIAIPSRLTTIMNNTQHHNIIHNSHHHNIIHNSHHHNIIHTSHPHLIIQVHLTS